jgi:hypothetical protein
MPAIQLSRLKLEEDYAVLRPLRGDSDIVRSEKKYDRHGFAEVLAINYRQEWRRTVIKKGDLVIYDDSNVIEFPLCEEPDRLPEIVECVHVSDIYGVQREEKDSAESPARRLWGPGKDDTETAKITCKGEK